MCIKFCIPPANGASLVSYCSAKKLNSAWKHCLNKRESIGMFKHQHSYSHGYNADDWTCDCLNDLLSYYDRFILAKAIKPIKTVRLAAAMLSNKVIFLSISITGLPYSMSMLATQKWILFWRDHENLSDYSSKN